MKKTLYIFLCLITLFSFLTCTVFASGNDDSNTNIEADLLPTDALGKDIKAKAAVLMDMETGTLLFEKNANQPLEPASVTKIMTLLLISEAIENGTISSEEKVCVSANAASMGGSQIYLKEGEEFTVEDLIKCTVIASANDCAIALAEHLCGSESVFVSQMNKRAVELGMNNTSFENCTGLDDTTDNHKTSAYDIALMSKELMKHEQVMKYSCVWQDSIRNGEFTLTNTNRLVRYYKGCTGLKTGSTDKAGFCVSCTANREEMHLIAVIMGAESRDERNKEARMLLDYGFANYKVYKNSEQMVEDIPILFGEKRTTTVYSTSFAKIIKKDRENEIEKIYTIPEKLQAPLAKGEIIGKIQYKYGDELIGESDIIVNEDIEKTNTFNIFLNIIKIILGLSENP